MCAHRRRAERLHRPQDVAERRPPRVRDSDLSALVETALFTDDVDATKAFYGRLLGATPVAEWPGGAIYAAGGIKLLVHERTGAPEGGPPNEDHVAFGAADLDGAVAALAADGFTFLVEPRDYDWGRSAYLRDPDGRLVELSQT